MRKQARFRGFVFLLFCKKGEFMKMVTSPVLLFPDTCFILFVCCLIACQGFYSFWVCPGDPPGIFVQKSGRYLHGPGGFS
jgi:hypothetical protein